MFKVLALFAVCTVCLTGAPLFAQAANAAAPTTPQPAVQDAASTERLPGLPLTICGQPFPQPAALPPAGSGPVIFGIAPCFEAQGNQTLVEPATYLYYIQLKGSTPSQNMWVPYDEQAEKTIREDFLRLWNTNFLDNLSVSKREYTFPNGVVGVMVTYDMEERQRVKIVDYKGSKQIEESKIDEKLKELKLEIRTDSFIDAGLVKKVANVVQDFMKDKGFQAATVTPQIVEMPGGPKLVHLTFQVDEGPKIKIHEIDFIGNKDISDSTLRRQMKENKQRIIWARMFAGRSTYQEGKFDEDADRILSYYRDRGYITARVGQPELKVVSDSSDKKTRLVDLKIPVTEGNRYRIGDFSFDGNTVVKSDDLRPMFAVQGGEFYSEKAIRKGLEKAREVYGAGGYFEFTGYPDYKFRDQPNPAEPQTPDALKADAPAAPGPPVVDVTMRLTEGKQFFVNRLTFTGNTTTHDNVIRREVRLVEDGVFNTEALKYSVKRLNQLGYFKPLEGGSKDVDVQKTPGTDNKVDVKLKLEEQNRNQLTFGAGVSEFEGFFGQMSFSTSNFLGRGESLTLSVQSGSRAQNYQVSFTEPFLFDRNITGGANVFRRDIRYIGQFTQESTGGVLSFGFPLGTGFTRMFTNYSYERVMVTEISDVYTDPLVLARNPYLRDSLLIGAGGERIISKVVPSIVHNTVDNPITPTTGKRFTLSVDLAGLGGNTNYYKPAVESVVYWKQNARMSLGYRAQWEYIHSFTGSRELPIFEKLFLGGEYSVRGFDIRTIGPQDPNTGLVLGGNKSLLFNIEELIAIAGPVRLVLFYDAGQVQPGPELVGPSAFTPLGAFYGNTLVPGKNFNFQDFKTSTGAEVRFFMPVLNVPFRLIFAYNPQRNGVLDNTLQPQKAFQFRFAVGSTF